MTFRCSAETIFTAKCVLRTRRYRLVKPVALPTNVFRKQPSRLPILSLLKVLDRMRFRYLLPSQKCLLNAFNAMQQRQCVLRRRFLSSYSAEARNGVPRDALCLGCGSLLVQKKVLKSKTLSKVGSVFPRAWFYSFSVRRKFLRPRELCEKDVCDTSYLKKSCLERRAEQHHCPINQMVTYQNRYVGVKKVSSKGQRRRAETVLALCIPFFTLEERVTKLALVSRQLYAAAYAFPFNTKIDFCSPPIQRLLLQPVFLRRTIGPLSRTLDSARFNCVEHLALLGVLGSQLITLTLENIPHVNQCPVRGITDNSAPYDPQNEFRRRTMLTPDPLVRWLLCIVHRCPLLESLTLRFSEMFPFSFGGGDPRPHRNPVFDETDFFSGRNSRAPVIPLHFKNLQTLQLLSLVSMSPLSLLSCAKLPKLRFLTVSTTSLVPTASLAQFLQQASQAWYANSSLGKPSSNGVQPNKSHYFSSERSKNMCNLKHNSQGLEKLVLYHGSNVANRTLLSAVEKQSSLKVLCLISLTSFGNNVAFSHSSLLELHLQYDPGVSWNLHCEQLRVIVFSCRGELMECLSGRCVALPQFTSAMNLWLNRTLPHCPNLDVVILECPGSHTIVDKFTISEETRLRALESR